MEIIHELFLYNLLGASCLSRCWCGWRSTRDPAGSSAPPRSPPETPSAASSCWSPPTRCPGCLTVSPGVFTDLGSKLSPLFVAVAGPDNSSVYRYGLEWEKK